MAGRRLEIRPLPAAVLALLLGGSSVGHASEPSPRDEVERLYLEGQDRYAEADYVGAAQAWQRLLALLPENEENRPTRESVIVNVLDAYLAAYETLRDDAGDRNIEHLRAAKAATDDYYTAFRAAYGGAVPVSPAIDQKAEELEEAFHRAENVGPCLTPPPCLQPCLNIEPDPRGCGGRSTDPPLALGALLLLGLRRRDALERVASSLPADVVARLRSRDDENS